MHLVRWLPSAIGFLICLTGGLAPIYADPLPTDRSYQDLMQDLLTVREIDQELEDRMPVTYNHLLEGGYLNMPSARVGTDGSGSFGYASVPPYSIWSARFQYFDRVELTLNYRIFRGIPDPVLSAHGFGDFSDKGANWKIVMITPEESEYRLPGIAFGAQDFLGTKQFTSHYVVLTQVIRDWDLELSFGWGFDRIDGPFGGIIWMPWRNKDCWWLKGVAFVGEYDGTDYENPVQEPHPDGRNVSSPINLGVKYRLFDYFDFSASWVRGEELAASVAASYPIGTSEGLITKIKEKDLYKSPVNTQTVGLLRPAEALFHSIQHALNEQGLRVNEAWWGRNEQRQAVLYLRITNEQYRYEEHVRRRIDEVLAALVPESVAEVIVAVDNEGLVVHRYVYKGEFLAAYREQRTGRYELAVVTPLSESVAPDRDDARLLFEEPHQWADISFSPRTHTFWGSSRGKIKYSLGINLNIEGFLWGGVYYRVELGKDLLSNLGDVQDVDMLNPSQIVNVRSDLINYLKYDGVNLDRAFLQKNWFLGKGCFTRVAGGYFEEMYAGIAGEVLCYPTGANWALGWESALFMKRKPGGLGLTSEVRQLEGFMKTYRTYYPHTHFLNFYYQADELGLHFRGSLGRFLAGDFGARFEMKRVFDNGVALALWYTLTTEEDYVNGERYHDKGIGITVPLDLFYEQSSRKQWNYGVSAWLRDVGAQAETGHSLFDLVSSERR